MSSNPPQAAAAISPLTIATAFIKQYYLILSTNNSFIHKFYKADSQISFSSSSNAPAISQPFSSLENVEKKFAWAANSRVDFANGSIDAQESVGGGILVVVTGEMFLEGNTEKKVFVQTFFLKDDGKRAPRRNYYVFNDVFRFLDKENVEVTPDLTEANSSVSDESAAAEDEKGRAQNEAGESTDLAEDLEMNGNNGNSETPAESEPEAEPKPEIIAEFEPEPTAEEEVTSDTEKEAEKEVETAKDSNVVSKGETEADPSDDLVEAPSQEVITEEPPTQEAVKNSKGKVANAKQKSKPPGSWASLVAGSSQKTSAPSADVQPQPSVSKQSSKKEKENENSNTAGTTNNERPKKPPKPQDPETEASALGGANARASGYGSKGSSSLYIKNVGEGISESDLKGLFSEYPFKIVNVSFYPSRGYAFVDFADANAVNSIMKENRQTFHINGRAIEVEKKSSDRRRSGGNNAGSGNGPRGGSGNGGGNSNRRSSPKGQRQRSHSGRGLNGGSDGDRRGRKGRSGGGDKKRDGGSGSGGGGGGSGN